MNVLKILWINQTSVIERKSNTQINTLQSSIWSRAEELVDSWLDDINNDRATPSEFHNWLANIQRWLKLTAHTIPPIEDGEIINTANYVTWVFSVYDGLYWELKNNKSSLANWKDMTYYVFNHPEKEDIVVIMVYLNVDLSLRWIHPKWTLISDKDFDITKFEIDKDIYNEALQLNNDLITLESDGSISLSDSIKEAYLKKVIWLENFIENIIPQLPNK